MKNSHCNESTLPVLSDLLISPYLTVLLPSCLLAAGLGIDDLYAAVSKVSKMNGGGAAPSTASPNPFTPPSSSTTEFGFGANMDFLSNKGSSVSDC